MPQITYKRGGVYENLVGLVSLGNPDPDTLGRVVRYELPMKANLLFDKFAVNGRLSYRLSEIFDLSQKKEVETLDI